MSAQIYKIYINGSPVFLTTPAGANAPEFRPNAQTLNAPYLGKRKTIRQYIDLLDKNKPFRAVVLHAPDLEALWADFKSCFHWLEAAGGYVENAQGQLLVMFRRGSWDLPKGKIDPGETPEQAALREVREETGLQQLALGSLLGHTYHTYVQKDKRILKKTWWYRMGALDEQTMPQTEEDIEEIRWVDAEAWLSGRPEVYGSIRDVIDWGLHPGENLL